MKRLVPPALVAVMLFAMVGCGGSSGSAGAGTEKPANRSVSLWEAPSVWPDAADYETIKVAVGVRDRALLHEPDWRRKAGEATGAMLTLISLRGHLLRGTCAAFVNDLYDELWSLRDGYQGEDWRPLVQWVHQHPTFEASCRRPAANSGPGL